MMRWESMQTKKRFGVLLLAILILFSVLFESGNDLPSICGEQEAKNGLIFLTDASRTAKSIQSVDEINTAVYHAILLRRITHKQSQRIQRICLRLFIMAGIAIFILSVARRFVPQLRQSRTVLIRYLHRSDGKK